MSLILGPYFYMMVGFPASGKSTWISQNYFHNNGVICSSDGILERIAVLEGKTYNEIFESNIKEATNIFFDIIKKSVLENKNILVDRTNLTVKSRKKILDLIPKNYKKIAIVIECPDEEIYNKRLNSRSGKTIPSSVVESMKKSFEFPTHSEGFHTILTINSIKNLGE
jgi:predicted kinase